MVSEICSAQQHHRHFIKGGSWVGAEVHYYDVACLGYMKKKEFVGARRGENNLIQVTMTEAESDRCLPPSLVLSTTAGYQSRLQPHQSLDSVDVTSELVITNKVRALHRYVFLHMCLICGAREGQYTTHLHYTVQDLRRGHS